MGRHWRRIKLPGLDATIHIISTASGALVVGGVRDICMYVVSKPIPGDSFECSME